MHAAGIVFFNICMSLEVAIYTSQCSGGTHSDQLKEQALGRRRAGAPGAKLPLLEEAT